jgi:ABC-2 type transport system ATP-binding protein
VAIVRSGAMVYEGAIADLKRTSASGYRLRTTDDERAYEVCSGRAGIADLHRSRGAIHFSAGDEAAAELSVALVEAGAAIVELARETATLEDLFFKLTEGAGDREPEPVPA